MALERQLSRVFSTTDKEQTKVFQTLLDEIFSSSSSLSSDESLKLIASKLLSDELNQHTSKSLLAFFCKYLKTKSEQNANKSLTWEDIWNHIITTIKQNGYAVLYDESDFICRDSLFNYYISCEQFSEAAQTLSLINLDSTSRVFTDQEKADILIKCAESYLENDETVDAETFVTKASAHINNIEDLTLHLRYRTAFARILDANRKFVEAASRYYELSITTYANINSDDLLILLGKAVTCAVLGKTGVQRSRIISLLCKDDRLQNLEQFSQFESHAIILLKMNNLELLPSSDLLKFQSSLMPHQQAVTSEGFTLLQKAVLEHNMLAIQAIYDNISFDRLANILDMDKHTAIKVSVNTVCMSVFLGRCQHCLYVCMSGWLSVYQSQ